MLESGEGLMTAATRQCAGRLTGAAGPRPGASGGWKGPGSTARAKLIVVPGRFREARFSQGVWANETEVTMPGMITNRVERIGFTGLSPGERLYHNTEKRVGLGSPNVAAR
jgi:hypothetical protein